MKERTYTTTDIIKMLPSEVFIYWIQVINEEGDYIEMFHLYWQQLFAHAQEGYFSDKYLLNISKTYEGDGLVILLGIYN